MDFVVHAVAEKLARVSGAKSERPAAASEVVASRRAPSWRSAVGSASGGGTHAERNADSMRSASLRDAASVVERQPARSDGRAPQCQWG